MFKQQLPFPLKALFCTIVMLGSMHLIISHITAITTGNYQEINYFHILAIDLIFPELAYGVVNFWLSQLFYGVYFAWLYYFWRQRRRAKQQINKNK